MGTFMGVPTIRIVVVWDLYWSRPFLAVFRCRLIV